MPICTYRACPHKHTEQPLSEFQYQMKGVTKIAQRCKTCREKHQEYQFKSRHGLALNSGSTSSQAVLAANKELEICPEPQFVDGWDKRMYQSWLQNLMRSVIRE